MLNQWLQAFRKVAESKSITQAAKQLEVSQPTVSLQIKQLEKHFGRPLLLRSASGISLTEAGRIVLDFAYRTSDLHESVMQRLGERPDVMSGFLRIGCSTTITQYVLPTLLTRFHLQHPGVELTVLNGNTEEMLVALLSHRIDLALVEGPNRRKELKATKFYDDEIVCVAGKDHPITRRNRPTLKEVASFPIIFREAGSGTRAVVELAIAHAGLSLSELDIAMVLPSSEAIRGVLASGYGISFLSRLCLRDEIASGRLTIVPISGPKITRSFTSVLHHGPFPGGPPGAFLEMIKSAST